MLTMLVKVAPFNIEAVLFRSKSNERKVKKPLPLSILFASILGLTGCNSDSNNQAHVSYSAADVSTYSEQELKAFE